jgi:hypothetical protein
MLEWLDNEMDKRITQYLFNFVSFMGLLCYLKASLKQPKPIPQVKEAVRRLTLNIDGTSRSFIILHGV